MTTRRSGAVAVEAAIVLPVLMLIVVGLIVAGVTVFRYQQAAFLAREGARWASVRGGQFGKEGPDPCPTRQQIADRAVLPAAAGIDPAAVDVVVEWIDRGANTTADWDAAPKDIWSVNAAGEYVTNRVRVTVTIAVGTDVFGDPVTVRGVCEMSMSN